MGKEQNSSSIKTEKGDMLAARSNQNRNATRTAFSQDKNKTEQVINARKADHLQTAKKKARKKAKMAKASRKSNKK
ncbi:MAG: hypothetical protein U9Q04_04090 [Campylobacterota bacterium]|nr:hypothetical protein [Campylobacterota bacterium]